MILAALLLGTPLAAAPQVAADPRQAPTSTPKSPSESLRFGAFLEQFDDRPSTGFVAYDPRGQWWVVPLRGAVAGTERVVPGELNGVCLRGVVSGLAFDGEDNFYLAYEVDDCIVAHTWYDKVSTGLGAADNSTHTGDDALSRGDGPGQLHGPKGVAIWESKLPIHSDGIATCVLYVADSLNHRVVMVGAKDLERSFDWATPLGTFGAYGGGDGQLNHPNDVAVDARGHTYVADLGNHRVVEFDEQGTFVRKIGGRGFESGLFLSPTGVDVHGDRLYVADRDNDRIQVFDLEGHYQYEWGTPALRPREGRGKLHGPTDVAISPDGTKAAVVEETEDRVQVFGLQPADTAQPIVERNGASHFGGSCSARGELFAVAEPSLASVSVYDVSSGTPIEITKFGRPGRGPGRFLHPSSVLFDAKAEVLYVADPHAYQIHAFRITRAPDEPLRFDPFRARLVNTLDLRAMETRRAKWTTEPVGLALDTNGDVLVVDGANDRVVVLDGSLRPRREVRVDGVYRPDLTTGSSRLAAMTVDPSTGHWFFVTGGSELVLERRPDGSAVAATSWFESLSGQDRDFCGITMTSSGSPWIVLRNGHGVQRVGVAGVPGVPSGVTKMLDAALQLSLSHVAGLASEPNGARERARLANGGGYTRGLGRLEFCKPESLAADGHGRVYVLDAGNHRVQILDEQGRYLDMFGARFYTEAGRTPPIERPTHPWDGARSVRTNGGTYRVLWKPRGRADGSQARIERGAPFAIDAWVFVVGEPDQPTKVDGLTIDAWMPEHLHGMTRVPKVSARDDGGFAVDGVLFHMSGFWELDFDVTKDGLAERAQVRVDVD